MVPMQSPSPRQLESLLHRRIERPRASTKYTPSVSSHQFILRKIAAVYTRNPDQSAILHHLFDAVDGRILAEDSLGRIAQRICESWEPAQVTPAKLASFIKFVKFILSQTNVPGEIHTLDEAVRICGYRHSAFPTVHAPLVLLLAIGYLDRLSLRYHQAKGEPGCAQRLFLMAYTIAAKYLHANLAPSAPPLRQRSESPLLLQQLNGPSAFQIHPSQFSQHTSPAFGSRSASLSPLQSPVQSPTSMGFPSSPPPSFMTMTSTTNHLAGVLPTVTTRELYRMEMEFLVFIDYNLHIRNIQEVERWRDMCVRQDCDDHRDRALRDDDDDRLLPIKQEPDCYDDYKVHVKMEQEDEGIGY